MTMEMERTRNLSGEQMQVRIVDSDVHPYPKRGELEQFIPAPFKDIIASRAAGAGDSIYYDAPDYAYAFAMRTDSFPDDGNFAGSDPELLFRQLIMEAGSDIAILGPLNGGGQTEEESHALCVATNRWQEACWLDSEHNWHQRYRGSICVAIEAPEAGAREIEQWAGHPLYSQVLINAEPRPAWGNPRYDPVWAAAVKHGIPVACHLGRGQHNELPMSPVGFMTYNHDLMVSYSMLAANQVMLPLPAHAAERWPGRGLSWGIRPEHLRLSPEGSIEATVEVVEPTGADTLLFARVGGAAFVLILHERTAARAGDKVRLAADPGQVHLFDGATGERLEP